MDTRRQNPQDSANPISRLFMWWTREVFRKASDGNLKLEDLYDPVKNDKSEILIERLEREWNGELQKLKYQSEDRPPGGQKWRKSLVQPSLKRAIFRAFFWENLLLGCFQLFMIGIVPLSQPTFQTWILDYYKFEDKTTKTKAFYYAAYFNLIALVVGLGKHQSYNSGHRLGMRVRVACCALIYTKMLRLHESVTGKTAEQVINLMSYDVRQFDHLFPFVHFVWIVAIQIPLVAYLMWTTTGLPSVLGVFVLLLLTIPFQLSNSHLGTKWSVRIASLTNKRVQFIREFLSGIKVVKIQTWEKTFEKLSRTLREEEVKSIRSMFSFYAFNVTSMDIGSRLALFVTLVLYVSVGMGLSAANTFEVASYFIILQVTLCGYLPEGFSQYKRSCASVKQIQGFLLLEETNAVNVQMTDASAGSSRKGKTIDKSLKPNIDSAGDHGDDVKCQDLERSSSSVLKRTISEVCENVQNASSSVPISGGNLKATLLKDMADKERVKNNFNLCIFLKYLIKASYSRSTYLLFGVVILSSLVFLIVFDYWSCYWTNIEEFKDEYNTYKNSNSTRDERMVEIISDNFVNFKRLARNQRISTVSSIYIYSSCVIGCLIFCWIRNYLIVNICLTATRNLYNSIFSNIVNTTLQFFHNNPSEWILNRFSKDIAFLDERLPKIIVGSIQMSLGVLSAFVLVIFLNYYIVVPLIILGVAAYFATIYYLSTIEVLQRLEEDARSLVFLHVNSTVNGLTNIRRYGQETTEKLLKEFHNYQDTSVWYFIIATSTAYCTCMELLCVCFMTCIVFFVMIFYSRGEILPGNVGLSITESLLFTLQFSFGLKQATAFLFNMAAGERLLELTKLPAEHRQTSVTSTSKDWPTKGDLEFRNYSMAYRSDGLLALKELNVKIESGWKVGIIGRIGSGKSSIISALLRLTDGLEGEIIIDAVDTKSVALHDLRSRISVIPREPVLFSEKLRFNLDPSGQHDVDSLMEALEMVELGYHSLDEEVTDEGKNFSVGERQLIWLARALLRKNRILILDEASENIDVGTEVLIQKIVETSFAACTVLTIARRFGTVLNSDRIIVMDAGRIVGFDRPEKLILDNPDGFLWEMLQHFRQAEDC